MNDQLKRINKGPFTGGCYRDIGQGIPVMLVHGFPVDGSLWNGVAAGLRKQYRLLIPDLPGSGQSPLAKPLSIEDMAVFVNDILMQEQVAQCVVIGHSMGGYITLAFAEKYPDKLLGFGLFHATAFADNPEKKEGRKRSIELMKEYGAGTFLKQMMPTLFSGNYRRSHTRAMQAIIESKKDADVNALTAYYRAMMERPDRTEVLRKARVPVLFVIGKEDTAAPESDMLKQAALPAISDVQLLNDIAHLGMLEKPAVSEGILENFIHLCQDVNQKG